MAYAFVVGVGGQSADDGGFTTSAIDTTGVDLLVVGVSTWPGFGAGTFSDSKGNTWTELTEYLDGTGSERRLKTFYCVNPTVGTGHTFSVTTGYYGAMAVLGFSGAATSSTFDAQNGNAAGSATTNQTGSVSPAQDNELLVSFMSNWRYSSSSTIDSSFTQQINIDGDAHSNGIHGAYKIQTTAGAENPTWSWSSACATPSTLVAFKAAATASGKLLKQLQNNGLFVGSL